MATDSKTALPCRTTPLRVTFVVTSLPVGGAEVLLVNLVERLDRRTFAPRVVCLKEPGALGERVAANAPLHANCLKHKWDVRVLGRLRRVFRDTDAVVTVGAGDKMFWGRLSAKLAGVPVICSALHSTGWPDGVGRLNRMLTPITDGFIACAKQHAHHLTEVERFPRGRVFMIPNGVDTDRFRPNHAHRAWLRKELNVPQESAVVGIVAALRPEKNHLQLVEAAGEVLRQRRQTEFVVVGEGPQRETIEAAAREQGVAGHFHFLGNRDDTESLLAAFDIFCLTSKNEANPVSILEALSCGVPVVAPDVGSVHETVQPGKTGILTKPLSSTDTADALLQLLGNPLQAKTLGLAGRQLVRQEWSLQAMLDGYEHVLIHLLNRKAAALGLPGYAGRPVRDQEETAARKALPCEALVAGAPLTDLGSPIPENCAG